MKKTKFFYKKFCLKITPGNDNKDFLLKHILISYDFNYVHDFINSTTKNIFTSLKVLNTYVQLNCIIKL